MKFLPLRQLDPINRALSFDTPDLRILGGCEIYTTKAAGHDKKLYKQISTTLSTRYEADLELSNSLLSSSPEDNRRSSHSSTSSTGSNSPPESRAVYRTLHSPFGSLSEPSARRTFTYLIATLNASHPDYDFSSILRPTDFRREKSLKVVINSFNTTLTNLGLRGLPKAKIWDTIDAEMTLRECQVFSYTPEDLSDDAYGDEGLIWSESLFFYNRKRKRVAYLWLRGLSKLERSKRGGRAWGEEGSESEDEEWGGSRSVWGDDVMGEMDLDEEDEMGRSD